MKINKLYKLVIVVLTFFILLSITTHTLGEYRVEKLIICGFLIFSLSFSIYKYFSFVEDKTKGYLSLLFLMSLTFESIKFIEYRLGLLPRYTDAPLFISIFFSTVAIGFYLYFILIISSFLNANTK